MPNHLNPMPFCSSYSFSVFLYEIVELTATGGANGITIAVLHTNSTGRLAPLNGMIVAATETTCSQLVRLIQHFGNGYPHLLLLLCKKVLPSPMNTTISTDATIAADTNETAIATEEEQQQR
jgi:hypothetical protein